MVQELYGCPALGADISVRRGTVRVSGDPGHSSVFHVDADTTYSMAHPACRFNHPLAFFFLHGFRVLLFLPFVGFHAGVFAHTAVKIS
jgi:hypothetical protein